MPVAGYTGTVKASGVAVAMVGEAMTLLTATKFQITNAAKRIVDPSVAILIYANAILQPATAYSFNYLFGIVTFFAPPAAPVTIDGSYLPVATIAESKGFTISLTQEMLDRTSFDSGGAVRKLAGLLDASFNLSRVSAFDDIDPVTGGLQSVESRFDAGTVYVIEFGIGGVDLLRAWVVTENLELGSEVDGLVTEEVAFQSSPQAAGAAWAFSS